MSSLKVTHRPAHENCCWNQYLLVLRWKPLWRSTLWRMTGWGTRLYCYCPEGTCLTHPGSLEKKSKPSS